MISSQILQKNIFYTSHKTEEKKSVSFLEEMHSMHSVTSA